MRSITSTYNTPYPAEISRFNLFFFLQKCGTGCLQMKSIASTYTPYPAQISHFENSFQKCGLDSFQMRSCSPNSLQFILCVWVKIDFL